MQLIRRAQISDAAELAMCIDAAYSRAILQGIELPAVSEGIEQDIHDHLVWVATNNDRIVGGIVVSLNTDHAHLVNIAVHPGEAGKGIAKSLIQTAVAEVRQQNLGRIDLATHVDMPGNVALYTHLGWVETGRSETKVYMSRDIG
jgi:N-acetylglutamate synthase-like GNAT family acetyltransferase